MAQLNSYELNVTADLLIRKNGYQLPLRNVLCLETPKKPLCFVMDNVSMETRKAKQYSRINHLHKLFFFSHFDV